MKYKIQGMKLNGREVDRIYDDYKVAKFEFECMQLNNISSYLALYQINNDRMKQLKLYINN